MRSGVRSPTAPLRSLRFLETNSTRLETRAICDRFSERFGGHENLERREWRAALLTPDSASAPGRFTVGELDETSPVVNDHSEDVEGVSGLVLKST
jgi:hypothetical protein